MRILSIDSTARICTAALCEDRSLLILKRENAGMTHSEMLLPMIEDILAEAGVSVPDIDMFALSRGPGSFTGVRIGAATVKGLAFSRNKPCVGVSSLEALAYNYADGDGIVLCAMDARREQVYTATFGVGGAGVRRLTEDDAIPARDAAEGAYALARERGARIYLSGDGSAIVASCLEQISTDSDGVEIIYDPDRAGQNAYSVALCAYDAYLRGESASDAELRPSYLRLAQAERERLERVKKESESSEG